MKNKEELEKKLHDPEFLKLFSGAKSTEEIAKIAQQQGYDITKEDVLNTTLTDDMLESVAGGKGNVIQTQVSGGDITSGQTASPVVTTTTTPTTTVSTPII